MNKRCSWISEAGQVAIKNAEARGGATKGDLLMLADRFGCPGEATWAIRAGAGLDVRSCVWACTEHVGKLLGPGERRVSPIVRVPYEPTAEQRASRTLPPMTFKAAAGASRADFGTPTLLGSQPAATPVIDFGINPTRVRVAAHGFIDDSKAYRAANEAFFRGALLQPEECVISITRPGAMKFNIICRSPIFEVPGDGTGILSFTAEVGGWTLDRLHAAYIDKATLQVNAGANFDANTARISELTYFMHAPDTYLIGLRVKAIGLPVNGDHGALGLLA